MAKTPTAKSPAANWKSPGSPDQLGPAEQIAHGIIASRADLLPSVERIMTAGLGAAATERAIGLFRDSLTTKGDPHRDPAVAISRSTGV